MADNLGGLGNESSTAGIGDGSTVDLSSIGANLGQSAMSFGGLATAWGAASAPAAAIALGATTTGAAIGLGIAAGPAMQAGVAATLSQDPSIAASQFGALGSYGTNAATYDTYSSGGGALGYNGYAQLVYVPGGSESYTSAGGG